jgi:hypothetical protein
MLVERRHEDHWRHLVSSDDLDHLETVEAGHLNVEKNKIGFEPVDDLNGLEAVASFPDDLDTTLISQMAEELLPRVPFIIDNENTQTH